jgi:hypothetical protein
VLDKFMRAVWTVVRNVRLQKRLEKIKEVLGEQRAASRRWPTRGQ